MRNLSVLALLDLNLICPFVCSDGLHLTQNGNRIVFEEVVQKLEEEGLSPETLPADLPLLSELDFNDPLKAFEK